MENQRSQLQRLARDSSLLREEELREAGISSTVISQAVKAGELIRLSRGVYHHPEAEMDENLSLSEVAARVPQAVITLLSALPVSSDRNPAAPRHLDSPQTERGHATNRLSSARSRPQQNGRFLFGGRGYAYPQ